MDHLLLPSTFLCYCIVCGLLLPALLLYFVRTILCVTDVLPCLPACLSRCPSPPYSCVCLPSCCTPLDIIGGLAVLVMFCYCCALTCHCVLLLFTAFLARHTCRYLRVPAILTCVCARTLPVTIFACIITTILSPHAHAPRTTTSYDLFSYVYTIHR